MVATGTPLARLSSEIRTGVPPRDLDSGTLYYWRVTVSNIAFGGIPGGTTHRPGRRHAGAPHRGGRRGTPAAPMAGRPAGRPSDHVRDDRHGALHRPARRAHQHGPAGHAEPRP